jgi:hypothetical protein
MKRPQFIQRAMERKRRKGKIESLAAKVLFAHYISSLDMVFYKKRLLALLLFIVYPLYCAAEQQLAA